MYAYFVFSFWPCFFFNHLYLRWIDLEKGFDCFITSNVSLSFTYSKKLTSDATEDLVKNSYHQGSCYSLPLYEIVTKCFIWQVNKQSDSPSCECSIYNLCMPVQSIFLSALLNDWYQFTCSITQCHLYYFIHRDTDSITIPFSRLDYAHRNFWFIFSYW